MGKHFGELYKISGIITYSLSPFEQRAFAKVLSEGIGKVLRRTKESFLYVVPPLAAGYLVYDQAEKTHHKMMRKRPEDFENEK